jgi:hypothetical protein
VIAIGGGSVYAASKLGKNSVHSRNIAPKAVKNSDVAPNAVTAGKIKNRTLGAAELTVGLLNQVVDEKASAHGGPLSPVNVAGPVPLPLTGKTTFTPGSAKVVALAAEAQFTLSSVAAGSFCSPDVVLLVNNDQTRVFASPQSTDSATPVVRFGRDADGPFGLINPGTPMTVTAQLLGDTDCTAQSTLDRVEVRIVQIG